ncbi:hypothetical protein [Chondromyces crocatus]|uniref:Lipoprotein n=1 Tax=Chondromyces crocatus TaxID=52 RepID=A0A0K1EJW7_CHOCO|nr:hypothetical protein [Chondromyces crocatus]AKT41150.1 uncharacterized protein CMC5_053110 [Chondromyces crocatus]
MRHLHSRTTRRTWIHGSWLLAASLGATGCIEESALSEPSELTVFFDDVYLTAEGERVQGRPLHEGALRVAARDDEGGFRFFEGEFSDDHARFPGVPDGELYVFVGPQGLSPSEIVVTSERELDLGRYVLQRPDVGAVTQPSLVQIALDGMSPWQEGNQLVLYSPGAGAVGTFDDVLTSEIALGATSIDDSFDMLDLTVAHLVDGDRGDEALLLEYVEQPSPGTNEVEPTLALERVFAVPSFTQVDGATTPIRGSLTAAPQAELHLDWKLSEFEALAASVHPEAKAAGYGVKVHAQPTAGLLGFRRPPALLSHVGAPLADIDVALSYGNPFPSAWQTYGLASVTLVAELEVPGSDERVGVFVNAHAALPVDARGETSFSPRFSPPQALRINGQDAQRPLLDVGVTPTVSWDPPAISGTFSYAIQLTRFTQTPNIGPISPPEFVVYTSDTQVVLPPTLLTPGELVQVSVVAIPRSEADAPGKAYVPLREGAPILSGLFRP